jgi:membrane-associated phospholipid phosphatase
MAVAILKGQGMLLSNGRPMANASAKLGVRFRRNGIIFLACLGIFLTLDSRIIELVKRAQEPHVFLLMQWVTTMGYGGTDLVIGAGLAFVGYVRRNSHALRAGSLAMLAVLASGAASQILKHLACRSRPYMTDAGAFHLFPCLRAGFASFPSGHVSTTVALAVVLAVAYPAWKVPIIGIAALVALSRIYLGLHFASDVLTAAFLAFTISTPFAVKLHRREASTGLARDVP